MTGTSFADALLGPTPHHVWREAWVFVQDTDVRGVPMGWIVGWLPRGHRHVWTATEEAPGVVLVMSADATHLRNYALPLGIQPFVSLQVSQGMTAVRIGHWIDRRRPWLRGWLTCVSLAKYLTGARWWWVVTPAQLVREAERRGFEVRRPDVRL